MRRPMEWTVAAAFCLAASGAWAASDAPLALKHGQRPVLAQQQGGTYPETPTEPTTQPTPEATAEPTTEPSEQISYQEPAKRGSSVYVLLGGGADLYTGDLTASIRPAPVAAVAVGAKGRFVGLEGMYNLAALEADTGKGTVGLRDGTDIVRNTVQAAATIGLLKTPIEPFVLSGGGFDFYNVRIGDAAQTFTGWKDDTAFYVPVGAGLRYGAPGFNVDLRYTYNFLMGEDFAPANQEADRQEGLLTVGGAF